MFYFLFPTLMSFDLVLIAAAVIPAVFLMIRAYRSDRLEKEPPRLLWNLVIAGVLASLIALVAERVLSAVLNLAVPAHSSLYSVLLYFVIVAFSEEGAKYLMLKRRTWRSPEFNCQYDGIVYALFVSLGFALWENISYVMSYGFGKAVIRALTAIPGHACFGGRRAGAPAWRLRLHRQFPAGRSVLRRLHRRSVRRILRAGQPHGQGGPVPLTEENGTIPGTACFYTGLWTNV